MVGPIGLDKLNILSVLSDKYKVLTASLPFLLKYLFFPFFW